MCTELYLESEFLSLNAINDKDVEAGIEKSMQIERPYFDEKWYGYLNKKYYASVLRAIAEGRNPYQIDGSV